MMVMQEGFGGKRGYCFHMLCDAALDEFVAAERALSDASSRIYKSFDHALIKMGSPTFYVSFHGLVSSRARALASAAAAATYALDDTSVNELARTYAGLVQEFNNFFGHVSGILTPAFTLLLDHLLSSLV